MASNALYLSIIISLIASTAIAQNADFDPESFKDFLGNYEQQRQRNERENGKDLKKGKNPLSMLTSSDLPGQGPSEDDLLESVSQHGIHSDSPSAHFLLNLYEKLRKGEDLSEASGRRGDLSGADTVRSFSNSDAPSHGRSRLSVSFKVTGMAKEERTQMAELRLRPVDPEEPQHRATIKRIKVTVRRNNKRVLIKRYRVKDTYDSREGFDIIDVTKIVRDVERELGGNMNDTTVEVTVKYKGRRRSQRDVEAINQSKTVSGAILVFYSKDKKFFTEFLTEMKQLQTDMAQISQDVASRRHHVSDIFPSRRRRSTNNKAKSRCGREDMTIDFDLIGWGQWIIYPKKYNAYKCSGKCPIPVEDSYEPTNHAVMQSLLRLKDKSAAPRPCCVPVALKPLSMLYYENGELVIRHHEDMVVDRCGCR